MKTDKIFSLKFGGLKVPEDDTTLYAAICDGANLVAYPPIVRNLYGNEKKSVMSEVS